MNTEHKPSDGSVEPQESARTTRPEDEAEPEGQHDVPQPPPLLEPPPVVARASVSKRSPTVRPARSRRKRKKALLESIKVVLGGLAGICFALVFLWYGIGIDPLGIMAPRRNKTEPLRVAQREKSVEDTPSKPDDPRTKTTAESTNTTEEQPPPVAEVTVAATETPRSTTATPDPDGWIDLQKELDPQAEIACGQWQIADDSLISDASPAAFMPIRYKPPAEFDLRFEFTRNSGNNCVYVTLLAHGAKFDFLLGSQTNKRSGFKYVNGQALNAMNPTMFFHSLNNGQRYTCLIQVRERSLRALLDGKVVTQLETDFLNMRWPGQKEDDNLMFGLGSHESPTTFHVVKLKPVSTPAVAASFGPETKATVATSEPVKIPVPPPEVQSATAARVNEIFKDNFEKAKTPEQKASLAKLIYDQSGRLSDDPVARFVTLRTAYDLAIEAGAYLLGEQAAEQITGLSEMDAGKLYVNLLVETAKTVRGDVDARVMMGRAMFWSNAAANEERFDEAERFAEIADSLATRFHDDDLRNLVESARSAMKVQREAWSALMEAKAALKEDPDDPAANLVYGKYLCLVEANWSGGLPVLAKCSSADIKAAAQLDLVRPTKPAEQIQVADAWYTAGKADESVSGFLGRAHRWYAMSVDHLTGLDKLKAEKRLSEIRDLNLPPHLLHLNNELAPLEVRAKLRSTLTGHTARVFSLAVSSDGRTLASASSDTTVRTWNISSGRAIDVFTGHTDVVMGVAISPDSKIVASAGKDGTIKLWDIESGSEIRTLRGHSVWVRGLVFMPDETTLVSANVPVPVTIRLWDYKTGEEQTRIPSPNVIYVLALSANGTLLASAGAHREISLWNMNATWERAVLKGHAYAVSSISFSPDGHLLASAGYEGMIKIWDVKSRQVYMSLTGHVSGTHSVMFSPNGRILASGGLDRTVKIWDVLTGRELIMLTGHTGIISGVAFSPDGRTLASASGDRTIKLWDIDVRERR